MEGFYIMDDQQQPVWVAADDIIKISADGHVFQVLGVGVAGYMPKNLIEMGEALTGKMIRANKNTLVNTSYIVSFRSPFVTLATGEKLQVSRRNFAKFRRYST